MFKKLLIWLCLMDEEPKNYFWVEMQEAGLAK